MAPRIKSASPAGLGIYLHIPFCKKKCPYCGFYSVTDLNLAVPFIKALMKEMGIIELPPIPVDTIYFGGGTPSLLDVCDIQTLLDEIGRRFQTADEVEITLEANPGTVTLEKLVEYKQAGINRLNLGVQSFCDAMLRFLGRIHNSGQALEAFHMARAAGFQNIGMDLIYGIPGQTPDLWRADLKQAVALCPEHLSCYMLTYEPGTPLEADLQKGAFRPLSENAVADLFDLTARFLEDNGYARYEVSNFSISAATRSRHNLKYWRRVPYIGLGPAAHSFVENRRSWNVRSLRDYLKKIESGRHPMAGMELLDRRQQMMEAISLGFRCADGIGVDAFESLFKVDFRKMFAEINRIYESEGYLCVANGCCRLTPKGMRFADAIARGFVDRL
jgi:oxygen-independent coproporphyrinogen III oxidase